MRRPWPIVLVLLAGCATTHRGEVDTRLLAEGPRRHQGVVESYAIACPDVLEVWVAGRPEVGGALPVEINGRIDLGRLGKLRVEGLSVPEIARQIAVLAQVPPEAVRVRVAEYRSRSVYLFGEVSGLQRAVAYQGQETVLDLLQRAGGLTPGAAPDSVYVIRPHIADGGRPEVYHVNLRAIVLHHDQRTNLRLQPYDQVYVGETAQARMERSLPPWLRPLYQQFWGMRPEPPPPPQPVENPPSQDPTHPQPLFQRGRGE
jgi:protein involved in polysaccharide export with SLBB domain